MHSCKLAQKRLEVWMGYHTNLNSKAEERKIKTPHILEKRIHQLIVSCIYYNKVNFRAMYTWSRESVSLRLCIVKSNLWFSHLAYSAFKETCYNGMSRAPAAASPSTKSLLC